MLISHLDNFEHEGTNIVGKPGWMQVINSKGDKIKPLIRCNCGRWFSLHPDHHVHPDGRITASFFDSDFRDDKGNIINKGCGWHVFIELENWTGEEYLPGSN